MAQYLEESAHATADGSNYDQARKAKADPIVCPVLAALYANGDLKCEEDGTMTREQLVEACMQRLRQTAVADLTIMDRHT